MNCQKGIRTYLWFGLVFFAMMFLALLMYLLFDYHNNNDHFWVFFSVFLGLTILHCIALIIHYRFAQIENYSQIYYE
jgi:hypothetical protein